MKPAPLLMVAVLLASCAPTTLQGAAGRVVNVRTGQEGRVRFVGGFQDRAALPTDPDNVMITIGSAVYSGKYTVLGGTGPRLGLSLGFGGSLSSGPAGGGLFGGVGFGGPQRAPAASTTRPGNLIARTTPAAGATVQTLTCSFESDSAGHGIGNCQDSGGGTYSLQF